jgi:cytochrome c553
MSGARRGGIWCAGVLLGLLLNGSALAADAKTTVTNVCAACHGMDGNSTNPQYPKLAGRHPEYLAGELKLFKAGTRKSDVMSPVVAALNPDDFDALGEYFAAQKPTSNKVQDEKAAALGKKLYTDGDEAKGLPSCGGCHGRDAVGNKRFPRLAGQHKQYLIMSMDEFRNDKRDYSQARLMREVAKRMTDEEIKAVAEYLSGL